MDKPSSTPRVRFLRGLGFALALVSIGLEVVSRIDAATQGRIQRFNDRVYLATSELSTLGIIKNYGSYFASGGHPGAPQDRPIGLQLHPVAPAPPPTQGGGFLNFALLAAGAFIHALKLAFAERGISLVLSIGALALSAWFIGSGIASEYGQDGWFLSSFWWIVLGIPVLATLLMLLLQATIMLASILFGRILQVAATPALLSAILFALDQAKEHVKKQREREEATGPG